MMLARSFLFGPASRVELHEKVLASGADIVCLDLEDAVPPDEKDNARALALAWIGKADARGPLRAVRINPLSTRFGLADLLAFSAAAPDRSAIVLPKVDDAAELRLADAALRETGSKAGLIALIESAAGLKNAYEIAEATPRLTHLLFGAVDLSAELGARIAPESLLYARARVVHAARAAGIEALDVPSLDFRNLPVVTEEARAARDLGFSGKAAIHPSNVATINGVFSPSEDEVARAKKIVAAYEASATGLAVLDGKLIERPVVRAMQKVLEIDRATKAGA